MIVDVPLCPKCCMTMKVTLDPKRFACALCRVHATAPKEADGRGGWTFDVEIEDDATGATITAEKTF